MSAPYRTQPPSPRETKRPTSIAAPPRIPTVLVVEDDPHQAFIMRTVLERQGGYRVEVASDGARALEIAFALSPALDLVLSDMMMPKRDGFELCRALRSAPSLEGVMIVMLTAHASPEHKIRALEAGVDDFLSKPVGIAELLAKARSALRVKSLHDRLRADRLEMQRLHEQSREKATQLLDVLGYVVELRAPGADTRADRLETAARKLAARLGFGTTEAEDLARAARLVEVGKLLDVAAPEAQSAQGPGVLARQSRLAASVLQRVVGLRGAAAILAAMPSAFDGSTPPDHVSREDIPRGARALRALVDFFAELDRHSLEHALQVLTGRAGTIYDPSVVAHLAQLAREADATAWDVRGTLVPVTELAEGMVLGEDLVTPSGLKLVSHGTRLTRAVLDLVRRRHENEPFLHCAVIAPAA